MTSSSTPFTPGSSLFWHCGTIPRPEVVWARSGMSLSWNLSAALGRLGRPGLGVPGAVVVFQNILPWLRFPSSNLYLNPKSVHLLRLCHLGLPARPPRLLPRLEKAAFLDASAAGELVLKSLNPPPGRCTSWASSVESETGLLPHHPRPAWMSSRSKASGFMLSPSALSKAWVSSPLARAACGPLASASLESSWGGSGVFLSSFLQRLSFWHHPLSPFCPEGPAPSPEHAPKWLEVGCSSCLRSSSSPLLPLRSNPHPFLR